jgi:hypothetical protein
MTQRLIFLGLLLAFLVPQSCNAQNLEIYVSPEGNDAGEGTRSDPVKSLFRAAELVRKDAGRAAVTVFLSGGNYYQTEALELGPEDGGTTEAPVTWKTMPGEDAIVSGGIRVEGWKQEEDGSWSARIPEDYQGSFRSFYVNGKRATRARHPNESYLRIAKAGEDRRTNFYFNEQDIPELDKSDDLELILLHDWSVTRIPVASIDWKTKQLVAVDSIGSRLNFFTLTQWEQNPRYFLENAREFCDQAGEWYADFKARKIYYLPLPGEDIEHIQGIIPVARQLLFITGTAKKHAGYIRFENITFEYSSWPVPDKGYCGIQACMFTDRTKEENTWSKVPAAIELNMAKFCSFDQCTIRHTGGSGIWIGRNCSGCEISGSHIHGISGNGVNIGEGQSRMVDGDPWWKKNPAEVSRDNRISHTLIEQCGTQFYGAVGIWCGLVAATVIEHNEIRDLPYSGISIGWMWTAEPTPCRENTIHANHIHHILNILSDGGGIYSLGLQPGSKITRNLIHDVKVNAGRAESNGMFLDEGTKELLVEGNIIYNIARSPLRFHKAKHPNLVRNNVLVCNKHIPPIRYNNTREEDIQKSGNIILDQNSQTDLLRLKKLVEEQFPDAQGFQKP